jgi:hypothetical protein
MLRSIHPDTVGSFSETSARAVAQAIQVPMLLKEPVTADNVPFSFPLHIQHLTRIGLEEAMRHFLPSDKKCRHKNPSWLASRRGSFVTMFLTA